MYSIVRVKIQETNLQYEDKEIIVVGYFPHYKWMSNIDLQVF